MKNPDVRHYTEEELLMHFLKEEDSETGVEISGHAEECRECGAVLVELRELQARILDWKLPEVAEEEWERNKLRLLEAVRQDKAGQQTQGLIDSLARLLQGMWEYALNNPLPTLGYIIAALAFASERTITVLRLDEILPASGEVFEILRQVF